ncbi:TetR/AcrR family transcriptional regulator [Rhodococcus sp. ACT016]|uniref:TetR/AcrR family transcriptional regulator n=1 Tax=Rhodococcus sp. ACT016 TaxID=3134808 RepID=UPI003D285952
MAGRPRSIDDAAILEATVRVMGRTGPAALTLSQVASEAGVVPGTLVQRFGSKRGLILALAEYNAQRLSDLREQALRDQRPPLEVLAELLVGVWEQASTPEAFANHLAFLCADLADAQFRDLALANHRSTSAFIAELLGAAVEDGELQPGTDVDALTDAIQSTVTGAGLIWTIEREGTLSERLHTSLERVLEPHRNDL